MSHLSKPSSYKVENFEERNNSRLGKRLGRRLLPRFFWARLMLYICFLQTIAMVGLTLYLLNPSYNSSNDSNTVYRLIFLVANIFSLIICWDAVTHKNTIQTISFLVFNCFCLMFIGIQYYKNSLKPSGDSVYQDGLILITIIVAECCCILSYLALTLEIYREHGWKIYKKLGADEAIHRMYMHHQVLIVLMQMELFLSIAVAVQIATHQPFETSFDSQLEKWIQIGFVIPFSVVVLGLSFYALIKEHKPTMMFMVVIHFFTLAYFIYLLIYINPITPVNPDPFGDTRIYLIFSLACTLVLNLITLVFLILCYRDFGRGLSEQIHRHRMKTDATIDPANINELNLPNSPNHQQRWELD